MLRKARDVGELSRSGSRTGVQTCVLDIYVCSLCVCVCLCMCIFIYIYICVHAFTGWEEEVEKIFSSERDAGTVSRILGPPRSRVLSSPEVA